MLKKTPAFRFVNTFSSTLAIALATCSSPVTIELPGQLALSLAGSQLTLQTGIRGFGCQPFLDRLLV